MNRKVIILTLAALLLPFVAQAHPLPTGAFAGVMHWLSAPDHALLLSAAVLLPAVIAAIVKRLTSPPVS
jgi:hydrogenase/urease accessory protein HupE